MITAFADAGRTLGEPSFVRIATEAADFILEQLRAPEPNAEAAPNAAAEAEA